MIKLNKDGLKVNKISTEEIVKDDGTKFVSEDSDFVFDSQIISEAAAINSLNHVNEATDAQLLAEVAAVDSLKYKSESVKAQLLAEAAAINAIVTKQETIQEANEIKEQAIQDVYDKQMLAETAAINALVYLEEARVILEEIKGLQQP